MNGRLGLGTIAVGAILMLAACGSGGRTYKSATQVAEALDAGGMTIECDSADSPAGNTVVKGAMSENLCYLPGSSSVSFLIDVFPGKVPKSKLLANSVSTGSEQILSVLGANWWVQTDGAHVQQVRKILGGTVVPGKWEPDTGN